MGTGGRGRFGETQASVGPSWCEGVWGMSRRRFQRDSEERLGLETEGRHHERRAGKQAVGVGAKAPWRGIRTERGVSRDLALGNLHI